MTTNCLAIIMVHGTGSKNYADQLKSHYGAKRAVTDTTDVQNGDIILLTDAKANACNWIASNVILLDGNRAPIVNKIPLANALAEIGVS